MKNKNWYPVDNVSFLYSVLKNKKRQNVFRFSCELKDDIDKDYLQIALRETLKVYDNFHINLKVGAFSYYFETSNFNESNTGTSLDNAKILAICKSELAYCPHPALIKLSTSSIILFI